MQSDSIKTALFDNLRTLDFEKFLKCHKYSKDFSFNNEIFNKPNPKAFQLVSFFVIKTLKCYDILRKLKGCYPCLDRSQEAEFAKIVGGFFKSLEKENPDIKILPIFYVQPGGEPFCNFMLSLTNYVMISQFSDKNIIKSQLDLDCNTLASLRQQYLGEYFDLCKASDELEQSWKNDNLYFTSRKEFIESELKVLNSSKDTEYANKNLTTLIEQIRLLQKENDEYEGEFIRLNQSISSKIHYCVDVLKNKTTNSLDVSSMNFDTKYYKKNLLDINLVYSDIKKIIQNHYTHLKKLELNSNDHQCILQKFIFMAEEINKQLEKMEHMLDKMEKIVKEKIILCEKQKKEIFENELVKERKEWFKQRIQKFLEPLNFEIKEKIEKVQTSASKSIVTPDQSNGSHDFSFHPMDISVLRYVPPKGIDRYNFCMPNESLNDVDF